MSHMKESLNKILEIQELDMKMIRLMRVKKERQKELNQIESLRKELTAQYEEKKVSIGEITIEIERFEGRVEEIKEKIKKLEAQQANVKKVDEFNALTHEITATERERMALEQKLSDILDRKIAEEEILHQIKDTLDASAESSQKLKDEILSNISLINEEGRGLKEQRDVLAKDADESILRIYERLLKNKKDRVVVPIENNTCSGCHIQLTPQHINLVRKGKNIVMCEHCSRIHYWPEMVAESEESSQRRRRRRVTAQ